MNDKTKTYYYVALILGLLFHATILFFTFEKTYDAYVHMFFAEHYSQGWFESWNQKWYTGFTITSYPPLVHQIVALMSKVVGLKMGFYIWSLCAIFLLIRGVYKFSLLWVGHRAAGIAAILAVFGSAIVEALHIFGQLPSITGIAILLNACPEIYKWFRFNKWIHFFLALALLTVTTTAHHVSTIFGMVFFVLPVIGLAVLDNCAEEHGGIENINFMQFVQKAIKSIPRAATFGFIVILLTVFVIFPYWYWSKTDPISQVSIPHGSRENFILESNLGIIFFLIPWGMMLFFLPYLFKRIFIRRNIFLALSLSLAFVLGTGGTTPIPKMILGETAFNILTLDRFTYWATMLSMPFWGAFFESLIFGNFKRYLEEKISVNFYKSMLAFFFIGVILVNVIIVNLGTFRPFQPETIEVKPITNFLNRDQHDKWRYLTLGFGDQMAWLSANTHALTVDGNYHSARRLPELTTRAVERLENAKYQKMEGIGALKDFLAQAEKYHLKYIFSNDKFYEPVLHFNGWTKVQTLENNIVVWEYPDVPPLPQFIPNKNIPKIQRWMWGVLPLSFFVIALLTYLLSRTIFHEKDDHILFSRNDPEIKHNWMFQIIWIVLLFGLVVVLTIKSNIVDHDQSTPEKLCLAYYDALDFKRFDDAYSFLDPETRPSFDQFMLELSVEDGILSSFAKLDSIKMDAFVKGRDGKIKVDANWITSLSEYQTQSFLKLKKRDGNWFIVKDEFEKNIPPDQFFSLPDISFKNQGRRKAEINNTDGEDVLDRPEVHVLQAALVRKDSTLHAIGAVQNIDNVPAFIAVEAILYDKQGNILDSYKASEVIVHDLLPKEITEFRIDFEKCNTCEPHDVVFFVQTMATDKELYKFVGIQNIKNPMDQNMSGEYINYGTAEINVPQLILGQYDSNHSLFWVDSKFLRKGIRPQRKKPFDIVLIPHERIEVLKEADQIFINGSPNKDMQILNQAEGKKRFYEWKKVPEGYISIKANGFVYELNK